MRIAYLDCFSGISGDMFVGSLLDAGLPFEQLETALSGLKLSGYEISATPEERNHIFGTRFSVTLQEADQATRHLDDVTEILKNSDLPLLVIQRSIQIFENLAKIEGDIHHISPKKVHFHEVGAVDSIVDIVATVAGIKLLGIEKVFASRIPVGSGIISSAHGRIPIPSPATLALLKDIPIYTSGQDVEMVTPTGAALISSLCSSFGSIPPMVVEQVGYGVGSRTLSDRPNLLRILIGSDSDKESTETVVVLEANLDDMSPELSGYLMESLLEAGARDVSFCPVHMKKNRPGIQLQVIGQPEDRERLTAIIFKESTTLGVRYSYGQRAILRRETVVVDSPWGKMNVKKVIDQDGRAVLLPEYEECKRIARENNIALRYVYAWAGGLSGTG
jgi:uncharacterized protein (TIGR00299 family) protein